MIELQKTFEMHKDEADKSYRGSFYGLKTTAADGGSDDSTVLTCLIDTDELMIFPVSDVDAVEPDINALHKLANGLSVNSSRNVPTQGSVVACLNILCNMFQEDCNCYQTFASQWKCHGRLRNLAGLPLEDTVVPHPASSSELLFCIRILHLSALQHGCVVAQGQHRSLCHAMHHFGHSFHPRATNKFVLVRNSTSDQSLSAIANQSNFHCEDIGLTLLCRFNSDYLQDVVQSDVSQHCASKLVAPLTMCNV